ncbi:apoptotic chromatin condensation inducer 1b isoform X7 [Etheostoma cragini]|uniref:apoptotic chromatin condensation inducer 1b isoform X7 n=1 Tax=Etheostoma cragini TaxID=417921 RepID=UPI00155F2333|nr:apoptotic chromatin condensation inducer 1b isoform X7 [Etheostoma cragini]
MADEDITLDGKPLQSLRVADLKAALEQRNLPKSGQKNTLLKRLKGALMLENLQKSSSSHSGLQPNSQIGEEMSQNSFIKQYLAKQQELLRQRLEREAQQEEESDESPAVPEEDEDHSEDNDSSSYVPDKTDFINFAQKHRSLPPTPSMTRAEEKGGSDAMMGHGMMACGPDMGPVPTLQPQESIEVPGARMQRATFHQGHKEPPAPSPPRAVASLSVRVLGQPDRQGLPPAVSRAQEKEGTAPIEPGSAHPVLHLSRSARASAGGQVHEDSADDDDGEDESENDEDWGPGPGVAPRGNRVPPQPQQMPPSVPSTAARSKRKLQPPQHIPPPQSPPDTDDQEGEGSEASRGPRVLPFPSSTMQRQDSESSSRSSSPEPSAERRPGPLSLLVHKMESEGAFHAAEATSAVDMSAETAHSTAGSGSSIESPLLRLDRKRLLENREMEEERQLKEEKEREQRQKQEKERKKIQEQERQKKRLEEEKEKERKQLEEDEKQRLKEEREKERKHQEEKKDRKSLVEEKTREEKPLKEKVKRQETANKGRVAVTEARDSGSSSDSDSKSDSSSRSSQSSSSSGDTTSHAMLKKADQGQEAEDEKKTNLSKGAEKRYLSKREVSEPSAAAVTEVEPESESSMAQQPPSGAEPENSEGPLEESTTPKAFAARKISLTSSKTSPATTDGGAGEPEMGTAAGRKRRWGSSTAVTAKKPSIIITTDSLKSLIPDIKVNQEAVVELHPEELQMSGDEECLDTSRGDQDKGLKIRRTVTQVVPGDQENGQTNEEEEVDKTEKEKQRRPSRDKRKNSVSEEASETKTSVKLEGEAKKVTPSDSLVRRSISQQKSGVSVTIDDPIRATRQPSPPHGKVSNIIHVTNLVRPFTLGQLKELLMRTGSMVEEGFWIDKIKSHCYVTYSTTEEAVATRAALHGFKWPPSNPKVLCVDFCEQDELDVHKGILKLKREEDHVALPGGPQNRLPPLMPEGDRNRDRDRDRDLERDRGVVGVRDLWAEREREMERRERARGEREWDRDKVREFARPGEDGQRSRSRDRERRRRERAKSKEKKTDKKAEKGDEPPVKLLDDLFLKTKAAPCIYWLPLSEEQAAQRLLDRTERQKERERRRKEQQEEEEKKREEEKKERLKGREKDTSVVVSAGAAPRGADRDRERDRGRDREGDKKRDNNYRPRRPSVGAGSGRRSRSRSNPRDRRR